MTEGTGTDFRATPLWTRVAQRDLAEIIDYIHRDRPIAARRMLSKIQKATEDLVAFPERGRVVPELAAVAVSSHRELIVQPYRLIYRQHERTVWVVAVLDSRRNLDDSLLERLLRS